MKMQPNPVSWSASPQPHPRVTQTQRTIIAEAQRIVLRYGRDITAHCAAVAGSECAKFADEICNTLLWSRMPPETWPISRLLVLLGTTPPTTGIARQTAVSRDAFRRIASDIAKLRALRVLHETVAVEETQKRGMSPRGSAPETPGSRPG